MYFKLVSLPDEVTSKFAPVTLPQVGGRNPFWVSRLLEPNKLCCHGARSVGAKG